MPNLRELYQSVYDALERVHQADVAEKRANLSRFNEQQAQADQMVQTLKKSIEEMRVYQNTAQRYVSSPTREENARPRRVDMSELENLYAQATTSYRNAGIYWTRLHEAATEGIAYCQRLLRDAQASVRAGASVSSPEMDGRCQAVLQGSQAQALNQALRVSYRQYAPKMLAERPFNPPNGDSQALFGMATRPFPVTDGCVSLAKQMFGPAFGEAGRQLLLPCGLPSVTLIQLNAGNTEQIMGSVRGYVVSFLSFTAPLQQKVYYIDACALDPSCLGVLQPLAEGGSVILPVPVQQEDCPKLLNLLRQTVSGSGKSGRRLLVYRFRSSGYDSRCVAQMQWLCVNAAHYNIQVIAVQELSPNDGDAEHRVPDWLPANALVMRGRAAGSSLEIVGGHSWVAAYPEPDRLSPAFLEGIQAAYKPAAPKTRYFDVRPMGAAPANGQRQRSKPVSLLYGVDESGKKYTFDMTGTDFAAYILGAAGTGKSNLLNILITSAIMDYHPDDLELWLVDFGRTEFSRYLHHTPPHVRYVLVEKTVELICGLVDKLIDEMDRRGEIMSQYHALKMQELPESVHMPVLLVIIDEFGVFEEILSSDEFEEKKKYRDYMERLLKQGRKHGMCFIFSNQSYENVYRALPDGATDQIGLRVALRGNTQEMKAVLEMTRYGATEEDEMRIQRLPKYCALVRSREQANKMAGPVQILYLTEEDVRVQEKMIDDMNRTFSPTATGRTSPPNTYHAHMQLLLDHNAIPSFLDRREVIARDYHQWQQNMAYQDTDLLMYLGEPRNMDPIHHELLRSGRAENILLYGDYARSFDRMVCVINSAVSSALSQQWPVEFWCDERDQLANYFENWHAGAVIRNRNKFSDRIQALEQQRREKTLTKRLIIVSGLSSVMQAIQDDLAEMAANGEEENGALKKQGMSADDLQRIRDQYAAIRAGNGNVSKQPVTPKQAVVSKTPEKKDPAACLPTLLDFAPRYGVHFLIVVQKEGELKDANLTVNHFTHYVAFASGLSNTEQFWFKQRVDGISDEAMFGCMTGNREFTVYAPFSLK